MRVFKADLEEAVLFGGPNDLQKVKVSPGCEQILMAISLVPSTPASDPPQAKVAVYCRSPDPRVYHYSHEETHCG